MKAIIFRHQLFKISEPFIVQQASELKNFEPVYLGRDRFGAAPVGSKTLALEDLPEQRRLPQKLWQVITRDPNPYIHLLRGLRPSLIHAHFGVEGIYALPLAHKLGIPLITTFHGFDATTSTNALLRSGSPSWVNYALFRKQLAQRGSLFLCVSDYIRKRVIALGFPEDRTHVHYIGINTENILPRQSEEKSLMVLHVARLVEKKGTEYLIRAFAKIAPLQLGVELVIIGDGPLRGHLESLATELGLNSRIRFLGAQPHNEVLTMMNKASMLVLPSVTAQSGDAEGLGMVLLEAAALGLPLVGSIHGGIPEVIEDGKTGFLFPERDVNVLADRMSELLKDKNLRRNMGNQARVLVESRFDIRKQTEKLEKLYQSVLS